MSRASASGRADGEERRRRRLAVARHELPEAVHVGQPVAVHVDERRGHLAARRRHEHVPARIALRDVERMAPAVRLVLVVEDRLQQLEIGARARQDGAARLRVGGDDERRRRGVDRRVGELRVRGGHQRLELLVGGPGHRDAVAAGVVLRVRIVRLGVGREQRERRVGEVAQVRVRDDGPRRAEGKVDGTVAGARVVDRPRLLRVGGGLEGVDHARDRLGRLRDGPVVVEILEAAEQVGQLGVQRPLAARGRRVARLGRVRVAEVLDGDLDVRERRVERGDEIGPVAGQRLDASDAVRTILLLLGERHRLAVQVGLAVDHRRQRRLVHVVGERPVRAAVADVVE